MNFFENGASSETILFYILLKVPKGVVFFKFIKHCRLVTIITYILIYYKYVDI